jgi:hypothetical protein
VQVGAIRAHPVDLRVASGLSITKHDPGFNVTQTGWHECMP